MTKKMSEITKKLNHNMETIVWLYDHNIITYEKAREELREEEKAFNELRSSMFHYGLLSEKDFMETCHTGTRVYNYMIDKCMEISWNR